jgi:hypothetical protein
MGWGRRVVTWLFALALIAPIVIQGIGWGGGYPVGG